MLHCVNNKATEAITPVFWGNNETGYKSRNINLAASFARFERVFGECSLFAERLA